MSDRFVLFIKDIDLVSTNDAYIPTYKGKHSFYRRSSELIKFQNEFTDKVSKYKEEVLLYIENNKLLIKNLGIKLDIIFILPRNMFYYKRKSDDLRPNDTSNYIKSVEDQLSKLIEIDDKYNLEVKATKCYSDSINNPSIVIIIRCVDYNNYYDTKVLDYYNIEESIWKDS